MTGFSSVPEGLEVSASEGLSMLIAIWLVERLRVWDGVQRLGFRAQGFGLRAQSLGFRA